MIQRAQVTEIRKKRRGKTKNIRRVNTLEKKRRGRRNINIMISDLELDQEKYEVNERYKN
jgi:hypothetical protein